MKETQLEQARLERESQLEQARLEERERDRQLEQAKLVHEQAKLALEQAKLNQASTANQKPNTLNLAKNIPLLPTFHEDDPDAFFVTFEKTAQRLQWEKKEWPWLLQPKLVGKASTVFFKSGYL